MLKNEQGMTLLELVLIIVVLAVGLTGVLIYFIQGMKDSSYSQNIAVATVLAQDLMEEIRSKCWDETAVGGATPCSNPVTPSAQPLGPDGETRATYDDVDDFNGLSNPTPINSQGLAMPTAYNIFTQTASVCYVAVGALDTCIPAIPAPGTSNYKRIAVTISWNSGIDSVQLVSIATNH